jgi:hypothetical protein
VSDERIWLNVSVQLTQNGSDWDTAAMILSGLKNLDGMLKLKDREAFSACIVELHAIRPGSDGRDDLDGGVLYVLMDEDGEQVDGVRHFAAWEHIEAMQVY